MRFVVMFFFFFFLIIIIGLLLIGWIWKLEFRFYIKFKGFKVLIYLVDFDLVKSKFLIF